MFLLHFVANSHSPATPLLKKKGFAAEGFNLHLAVASICTSHWLRDASWVALGHLWASHPAKPGLSTEKASQKPGRDTGKQHGLASPRRPFLDLRWGGLQCQTLRPEPIKKRVLQLRASICTSQWLQCQTLCPQPKKKRVLQLRASICTSQWLQFAPRIGCEMHLEWRLGTFERYTRQNQDSAPKKLPRSRAAKQGNSMAWRAQGDRFWTCVGVVCKWSHRILL